MLRPGSSSSCSTFRPNGPNFPGRSIARRARPTLAAVEAEPAAQPVEKCHVARIDQDDTKCGLRGMRSSRRRHVTPSRGSYTRGPGSTATRRAQPPGPAARPHRAEARRGVAYVQYCEIRVRRLSARCIRSSDPGIAAGGAGIQTDEPGRAVIRGGCDVRDRPPRRAATMLLRSGRALDHIRSLSPPAGDIHASPAQRQSHEVAGL